MMKLAVRAVFVLVCDFAIRACMFLLLLLNLSS